MSLLIVFRAGIFAKDNKIKQKEITIGIGNDESLHLTKDRYVHLFLLLQKCGILLDGLLVRIVVFVDLVVIAFSTWPLL